MYTDGLVPARQNQVTLRSEGRGLKPGLARDNLCKNFGHCATS